MACAIHVEVVEDALSPGEFRKRLSVEKSGCIVSFEGIVRGMEKGVRVKQLEFDAWRTWLVSILVGLARSAAIKWPLHGIVIAHRVGVVGPSEPIVSIHVSSAHRVDAYAANNWLIDEMKSQAPLWKKEVTEMGETWRSGLG